MESVQCLHRIMTSRCNLNDYIAIVLIHIKILYSLCFVGLDTLLIYVRPESLSDNYSFNCFSMFSFAFADMAHIAIPQPAILYDPLK